MHTDTFSFEVENEGEVYKIRAAKHNTNGIIDYGIIITIPDGVPNKAFGGVVNTFMDYCVEHRRFVFSTPLSADRFGLLPLEQKISDKIISRNL